MRYFRWTQNGYSPSSIDTKVWYLEEIDLRGYDHCRLKSGKFLDHWDKNVTAFFGTDADYTDFPFTAHDIPVYSPKLSTLIKNIGVKDIQYLPITIMHRTNGTAVDGYCIANYLSVVDCLDRNLSDYQVWTKENLLFWEERPWMLGTFRDVQKAVLDVSKIGDNPLLRLHGWEVMVVVREDVKRNIEQANITGCVFTEVETI